MIKSETVVIKDLVDEDLTKLSKNFIFGDLYYKIDKEDYEVSVFSDAHFNKNPPSDEYELNKPVRKDSVLITDESKVFASQIYHVSSSEFLKPKDFACKVAISNVNQIYKKKLIDKEEKDRVISMLSGDDATSQIGLDLYVKMFRKYLK